MGKLFDLVKGQTFLSLSSFFSFKKKIKEYFAMCIPPWKTFKKQHFKVKFCIWGLITVWYNMTCVKLNFKNHSTLVYNK